MNSLRQALAGPFTSVYFLSETDKRFISSFGTSDKPVTLAEFLKFWNSLNDDDRTHVLIDYEPEENPGTEGFKE